MGAAFDEETLIAAVVRVRSDKADATANQVHQQLVAEGADVTLAAVKKASSKAAKRGVAPATTQPSAAPSAPTETSKKEQKAAKAQASMLQAAETHMMDMNRKLRLAIGEDEFALAMQAQAKSDMGEQFIKAVTERALEAKLTERDALVPRERVAADLATLEWMVLAHKGGTLTLPDDARESAVAQIERLKRVRESAAFHADRTWVGECFELPEVVADDTPTAPPSGIDYAQNSSVLSRESAGASVDRALAKSGMLGKTIGGGFDDDID